MISKVLKWLMFTTALLAMALPAFTQTRSNEGQNPFPNLIMNSSFEARQESGQEITGWNVDISRIPGFKKSGYYWEESGFTGQKALGLTAGEAEPAVIWTEINNVKPYIYYILQFWAKRDSFEEGVYLETELFNIKKRWDTHLLYSGWQKFFTIINSGETNGMSHLKFINRFASKFHVDEISLIEYKIFLNPPVYVPSTKQIRISWTEPEHDFALRFRVNFSKYLPFSPAKTMELNSSLENALELSDNLARGRWYWRVEAFHGDKRIAISEIDLYEGDSFFPIGIYGVPLEELLNVKEAGFNTAQNYSSDTEMLSEFLRRAESIGIQVMISPPDSDEFVLKAKKSPSLLAWYLADEPEGRSVSPKVLLKKREKLRRIDPTHPCAIVLVRSWASTDYELASDILMSDQYPIPHAPLTWLSDSMEEMKLASAGEKPVWAVIQAFMSQEEGWPREPTYHEMRALTFLSLVHGAEGIFYFTYKGGAYAIRNSPEHWENLKKLVYQLNRLKEWLPLKNLQNSIALAVTSPFKSDANGAPAIHYSISKKGNKTLIVAVNVIDRPVSIKLSGLADRSYPAEVLFENRRVAVINGEMRDYFQPYETHIYLSE